jgi:hypothetical protein
MSRIFQLIQSLRLRGDVEVLDKEQCWLVVISKGPDMFCEVTIPREVLEWIAGVKRRQDMREIWSDWMDNTGYDDSPMDKLEAEMADAVSEAIQELLQARRVG